jgi:hypothetical protein
MGKNRTEVYKPCFRAYRDMNICSMKVIGRKQIQGGCVHITMMTLICTEMHFTLLQYSSTPYV